VLDRELEDKILAFVGERVELRRGGEEAGIRVGLNTLVLLLVAIPLTSSVLPLASSALRLLPVRLNPSRLPRVIKGFLVKNLGTGCGSEQGKD